MRRSALSIERALLSNADNWDVEKLSTDQYQAPGKKLKDQYLPSQFQALLALRAECSSKASSGIINAFALSRSPCKTSIAELS